MVRLMAMLVVLLGTSFAVAHDHWINRSRLTDPATGQWCCNHMDCAPIPVGGVVTTATGYLIVETGEVIPSTRLLPSEDGEFWRCRNMQTNMTRCLIGPPPGS